MIDNHLKATVNEFSGKELVNKENEGRFLIRLIHLLGKHSDNKEGSYCAAVNMFGVFLPINFKIDYPDGNNIPNFYEVRVNQLALSFKEKNMIHRGRPE